MELIEAFSPLKATFGPKESQIWTNYQDGGNLELSKYFAERYFGQRKEKCNEGESVSFIGESAEIEDCNYFSNGVLRNRVANVVVCANSKVAKVTSKCSNSIDSSSRLDHIPYGNRSGLMEVQELLSNLVKNGVSVMVLVGADLERCEANELININRHQLGLLVSRTLGLLPGTCSTFQVERYRKFGNDFWFENYFSSGENPARKQGELCLNPMLSK